MTCCCVAWWVRAGALKITAAQHATFKRIYSNEPLICVPVVDLCVAHFSLAPRQHPLPGGLDQPQRRWSTWSYCWYHAEGALNTQNALLTVYVCTDEL